MSQNSDRRNIEKTMEFLYSPDFELEECALRIFKYQRRYNKVYADFLGHLNIDFQKIIHPSDIPGLPVGFFKNFRIKSGEWEEERIFLSSGTSDSHPSLHCVRSLNDYLTRAENCFRFSLGPPERYCFLALLPAYLERSGSSLIEMMDHFISLSPYSESGYYLHNHEDLEKQLISNKEKNIPTLLFGVSFALMDFAKKFPGDYGDLIIMETGGMKGRAIELPKPYLTEVLQEAFTTARVCSEFGMTEMFSQAYANSPNRFGCPPGLAAFTTQITDPLTRTAAGETGRLHIIDLANIDTCSFLATDDLARVFLDGTFELLGRIDHSDVRGCNLLVAEGH